MYEGNLYTPDVSEGEGRFIYQYGQLVQFVYDIRRGENITNQLLQETNERDNNMTNGPTPNTTSNQHNTTSNQHNTIQPVTNTTQHNQHNTMQTTQHNSTSNQQDTMQPVTNITQPVTNEITPCKDPQLGTDIDRQSI